MCLMNYCSYCMHFELISFRNLASENYTLRLDEDDTAIYLHSLKIQCTAF